MMNCEEFELRGLDLDRSDADPKEGSEATAHARVCGHCSALLESWREVKSDLRLLREATRVNSAPARVEMRLRQELRTRREARVPRSAVTISAWALAAAAVLIGAVSWGAWQRAPSAPKQTPESRDTAVSEPSTENALRAEPKKSGTANAAVAKDEDSGKFTLLPGSLPSETEEAAIVRVRMQRGALGALGFPVNEERAGEWIQVDLLVGNDGLPQAVRLAR
ncbi:MAG: hypothetical protein DMG34_01670 [Acidobacteria bacterium]|nr:MAG: hypothetical protein DMG34_01670 [Acidobacteriota bacterium]